MRELMAMFSGAAIELGLLLFFFLAMSATIVAVIWTYENYAHWLESRKRIKVYKNGHAIGFCWDPPYWMESKTLTLLGLMWHRFIRRISRLLGPPIKAILFVPKLTRVTRLAFNEAYEPRDIWHHRTASFLGSVHCETCGEIQLGITLERLPDEETGDIMTNKPKRAVCLKCLGKLTRKKARLYTVLFPEYPENPGPCDVEGDTWHETGPPEYHERPGFISMPNFSPPQDAVSVGPAIAPVWNESNTLDSLQEFLGYQDGRGGLNEEEPI